MGIWLPVVLRDMGLNSFTEGSMMGAGKMKEGRCRMYLKTGQWQRGEGMVKVMCSG